jgi:predicted PurR-regulated permease PerM
MVEPATRIVVVRPRTILLVLGISLLVLFGLALVYLAWHVITWVLIAVFLAAALNPAVEFFIRRGLNRPLSAAIVFLATIAALTGLGFLVIPPLVGQIREFVAAVPGLIDDLTKGRGPLGFLERDYEIVERARAALQDRGLGNVLGVTAPAVAVAKSVITAVVGAVTIAFLTFFMLLEGPNTIERFLGLLPKPMATRWERVGREIYKTISGYVTGNLAISLIAGSAATIVLLSVGSKYAVALGVVVAVLDLIPLAGATLAAVIVTAVVGVELGWVQALIVGVFFILYQQLENHVLQPLVYGRTVQLSPLLVLVSVLIGAELAGILGALAAIPVAGSVLAILRELVEYHRERGAEAA